jgi:biotin transport system substrate-specific component
MKRASIIHQKEKTFIKTDIRDMAQIAIFAVLMFIGGKITIPFLLIPFTLQFAVCLLTGILLGARKAMVALLIYILLGLAGLPVFAAGGGPAYIFQPSFGYLPGMLLGAGLVGLLTDRADHDRRSLKIWLSLPINLAGMLVVHIIGVTYLFMIKNIYAGQSWTFLYAVQVGMLPFLLTDGLHCLLAAIIGPLLRRATRPFFKPVPVARYK